MMVKTIQPHNSKLSIRLISSAFLISFLRVFIKKHGILTDRSLNMEGEQAWQLKKMVQ